MTKIFCLVLGFAASLCQFVPAAENTFAALTLASPDGQVPVSFKLSGLDRPGCDVNFRDTLVASGAFGLSFAGSGRLQDNFKVNAADRSSRDEMYKIPLGKASSARDHHNALVVPLEESAPLRRRLNIEFRAFDDGVAFRYVIPKQETLGEFVLTDEHTRLSFASDPRAKFLPLSSYTTP